MAGGHHTPEHERSSLRVGGELDWIGFFGNLWVDLMCLCVLLLRMGYYKAVAGSKVNRFERTLCRSSLLITWYTLHYHTSCHYHSNNNI